LAFEPSWRWDSKEDVHGVLIDQLVRDPRVDDRRNQSVAAVARCDRPADIVEEIHARFPRGRQGGGLELGEVGSPIDRDGHQVQHVVASEALVEDGLGHEHAVRNADRAPRALMPLPYLENRSAQQSGIDHIAANPSNVDPITDCERVRAEAIRRPLNASQRFLRAPDDRHGEDSKRDGESLKLRGPNDEEAERQDRIGKTPNLRRPTELQLVIARQPTANESEGDVSKAQYRQKQDQCRDGVSQHHAILKKLGERRWHPAPTSP
jgi:hypothetical protein